MTTTSDTKEQAARMRTAAQHLRTREHQYAHGTFTPGGAAQPQGANR